MSDTLTRVPLFSTAFVNKGTSFIWLFNLGFGDWSRGLLIGEGYGAFCGAHHSRHAHSLFFVHNVTTHALPPSSELLFNRRFLGAVYAVYVANIRLVRDWEIMIRILCLIICLIMPRALITFAFNNLLITFIVTILIVGTYDGFATEITTFSYCSHFHEIAR